MRGHIIIIHNTAPSSYGHMREREKGRQVGKGKGVGVPLRWYDKMREELRW